MLRGRVVKRYQQTKSHIFFDVVGEVKESVENVTHTVLGRWSVSMEKSETAYAFSIGDLVSGQVMVEERRTLDARKSLSSSSINVVSPWDPAEFGSCCVDWQLLMTTDHFPWSGNIKDNGILFAIQTDMKYVQRLIETLASNPVVKWTRPSCISLSGTTDRIVLVRADSPVIDVFSDVALAKSVRRIYRMSDSFAHADLHEAVRMACISSTESSIRVQTFPRGLTSRVLQSPPLPCDPKGFTHVLNVLFIDGLFVASMTTRAESLVADIHQVSHSDLVCRAQSKLQELFQRRSWTPTGTAIDIGASPGGWSNFLAKGGCSRVIAVDNGQVVVEHEAVEHWKMQGMQAIEKMLFAAQRADEPCLHSPILKSNPIDLFVCDANVSPSKTLSMLIAALPLMHKESKFVITLKNTCKTKRMFQEEVKAVLEQLSVFADDVQETHLVSNTTKETTISARMTKS